MKQPSTSLVTQSGILFDYLNPEPHMISIRDIIISLSRMNRFLGHTERAYSVGEHTFHCLVMAQKLNYSEREQMLVFIHDFTEAYVGDCPSPLKRLIPDFSVIEERVEHAICKHIGMKPPTEEEHEKIKRIDMTMLTIEMKQLTSHDWMKFYEADICKEYVDDEDFDLSDAIGEKMLQDLLRTLFEDLVEKLASVMKWEDFERCV